METFFDAEKKVWSGRVDVPLYNADVSVGKVAQFVLQVNPDKVIQICATTGEKLTCRELLELATRAAQNLRHQHGIQQGDVIGLVANNTTYLAPLILGGFLLGAPISPIHFNSDRNTIKNIFGLTRPKVIICDAVAYDTLVQGLKDIGLKCSIWILAGEIPGVCSAKDLFRKSEGEHSFTVEPLIKGGNQTAVVLCSSGTTGLPKPVSISHRKLLGRTDFSFIGPDDVLFTFSTFHWISAVWILLHSITKCALRIVTDQPYTPEHFFHVVEEYKVTVLIAASSQATLATKSPDIAMRDLSSIRVYMCGGSPVPVSTAKRLNEYIGRPSVSEAYGFSEFGGVCSQNRWPRRRDGSVGLLSANTKAKIVSEDGKPLGIGEKGEICLWCPITWTGYYKCPEMTKDVIDSEGWMRSGDLGYFDEDGFLFVCGRQKEILKYNGFQISPIEIEEFILKIPGVIEACVFGIHDELVWDLPAAAVVKNKLSDLSEDDICQAVANYFTDVKRLRGGVYFLNELPKTTTGKVQRQALAKIVSSANGVE